MRIPEHIVEEIKQRADIVEIIGEDLQLKISGSNHKALSPFTTEKTPSFVVSGPKQIFKCFSTGKGGNVYTYLMEMHGMSFIEAVKHLAERYGITIPADKQSDHEESDDIRGRALQALEELSKYYQNQLNDSKAEVAREYIRKRKLSRKSVEDFGIGYAPDDWDSAYSYMKGISYSDEELLATGGFSKSKRGGMFDKFRGRLIFPIRNYLGKCIGFGGRDLSGKKDVAKYLNSPQTEIYNKSRVLYGLDLAKDDIRSNGEVILTEGYLDVIALHEAGYSNTVSTSGTALTLDMIKLIKRYANTIYLIFDSDKAGINAAKRAFPIAIAQDMDIKAVALPEGEDPDSIIRNQSKVEFQVYLNNAVSPIEFLFDSQRENGELDSPSSKAIAAKEAVNLLSEVNDDITKDIYISEISKLYSISKDLLASNNSPKKNRNREYQESDSLKLVQPNDLSKENILSELSRSDIYLLKMVLESYENLEMLERELNLNSEIFSCDYAATFFDKVQNAKGGSSPVDAILMDEECEIEYKEAASEILLREETISMKWKDYLTELPDTTIRDIDAKTAVNRLLIGSLSREKKDLIGQVKSGELSYDEQFSITSRIREIDKLKKEYELKISVDNK